TDNEYAQFSDGGTVRVAMAPLADPLTTSGITVKYRGCFAGGATAGEFDFTLKEGDTTIATWTEQLTDGFADGSYTLEPEEAAAVTAWSDLNITAAASLDCPVAHLGVVGTAIQSSSADEVTLALDQAVPAGATILLAIAWDSPSPGGVPTI